MADAPHVWRLPCPWCPHNVIVNPRGGRGKDQGAGVEAADLMKAHVVQNHDKTWSDFLGEFD